MAYSPTFGTVRSNEYDSALFSPFGEFRNYSDFGFGPGGDLTQEIAAEYTAYQSRYREYRSKMSELHEVARTNNPSSRVRSEDLHTAHAGLRVDSWNDTGMEQLDEKLVNMDDDVKSLLRSSQKLLVLSVRQTTEDWNGGSASPFQHEQQAATAGDLGLSWQEEELPEGVRVIDPSSMMHRFEQLEAVAEGPEYDETSLSTCSTRPAGEPSEEPALLRKLHRRLGQLSIQQERLANLCIDHEEEFVDRNFRLDQGQDVQPSDKIFERRFQRQSQKIMNKIDTLAARIKYLEKRCVDAGIPIPQHQLLPELDNLQEEISSPFSQQQRPLEEDNFQEGFEAEALPNSRPPSPGASDKVSGWMQALTL